MTNADLGKQLKEIHPEYADLTDEQLGAKLVAKYGGIDTAYQFLQSVGQKMQDFAKSATKNVGESPLGTMIGEGIEATANLATGQKTPLKPSKFAQSMTKALMDSQPFNEDGSLNPHKLLAAITMFQGSIQPVDDYLYHGTDAGADLITSGGLKPTNDINPYVSLTDQPDYAKLYGQNQFRVRRDSLGEGLIPRESAAIKANEFAHYGHIPPSAIETKLDGQWVPLESLQNMGSGVGFNVK